VRPLLSAALLATVLAGPALAQPNEGDRPRGRPQRDEVFKMVDAYVVSNLQESLGLSEAEFVKLLPIVRRLQTERREATHKRLTAVQELRKVMRSGSVTESQVASLLRDVKTAEAEEAATQKRNRDAVDAALSPLQQAKFRVMEAEVERKLRELMAEMRQNRRPGGAPLRKPRDR
jgi:hypothetical protein